MSLSRWWTFVLVSLVWGIGVPLRAQSDEALRRLADRYWDARMERYPTAATELGDYRFNDRLTDVSDRARKRWSRQLNDLLRKVRGLDERALSDRDRLTRTLLERSVSDDLLRLQCHPEYTPLDPLNGPHIAFPLILVSQPFRNAADFRAYIARLRAFPKQVADHIANMRAGVRRGMVPPRVVLEKVVPQIRTHIVDDVTRSEFYKPVEKASALNEADRAAVIQELQGAIESDVIPAYRRLLQFVTGEYLPAGRSTVGIGSLPSGPELYKKLAYLNTTVPLSPDAIHKIGLSEVARIRGEMRKVQDEVGFEGPLDDFLTHMRTDPRYRFASAAELYAAAEAILDRTKPLLPKLFTRMPHADCVVKEIEPFRAGAAPVAYYNPTPEDGARPGYFYINTFAPRQRLRFTLEALTYHEAVPGHHLQLALDQENAALPKFRRYGQFTAYVEGWALYSEKLGYEIGGYRTPDSRFGQLTFEMWRACRLVVDTGIHAKGWSRQQAIDFLAKNTSLAPIDISAEVDRYISWPGQALAYKIGERRIVRLRKEAQARLGDRFDLRAFHDALLSGGAMPIDILETRMKAWIEARSR